jgi:MFS family permease
MTSFDKAMGTAVSNASKKGYLVSVLELGAWTGAVATGYLADKLSRKYTIFTGMWY